MHLGLKSLVAKTITTMRLLQFILMVTMKLPGRLVHIILINVIIREMSLMERQRVRLMNLH
ncbi:MAG: hypothetical protein A3A86_06580 [Elusimicrobia bacterium RIFCSPLOWO2_01_FULL_60_11]|nr:MAG: hypothetical protein A3A86_06580 [Elusimicrobia bacterium RIFCSPLOWO2_01_FULL_60_11]